jgi:hypothetical protein
MRPQALLIAVALSAGSAGCGTFWQDTVRNVAQAPIRECDEVQIHCRCKRLAREAWREVRLSAPGHPYSPEYGDGFIEGYAEFLEIGGHGEPPAVPPFRFRLKRYQTPQGYRAVEDWFAGYRDGARTARESGLRELFVVPLSAPPINALDERPPVPPPPPTADHPPELPPPRRIEPGAPAGLPQGRAAPAGSLTGKGP